MEENIQKYEFENEKKIYKLTTSIIDGNYIKILCNPKNHKYGYINQFSKEDLIKINSVFVNYDNIKQIKEAFDKCIEKQRVAIFHNRTIFNIFFYINNKNKTEKIPLQLIYENEYIINNKPNNNNNILNDIEKEMNKMEKEQKNMKNKLDEIILELNNEKNKNENINKQNKIYFNEHKLKNIIKSDIIKTEEEYNMIKNKILNQRKNKISKSINYNLIYKASKDSDKIKIFHEKCDNKKNTLILIETNEGIKFGGFTTQTWEGNKNKKDENAFVFSLNKLKIYDIIKDKNAIICDQKYGPIFCGYQIFINDNYFKEGGKTGKAFQNYNTQEDYELNNGNMFFNVKELEVFEIFF